MALKTRYLGTGPLGLVLGIVAVDWVGPGIFNIFPNGFNKGPYILMFFKRF